MVQSLRSTKRDWIIAGVITLVAAVLVILAVVTAPIRHSSLTAFGAPDKEATISAVPTALSEIWHRPDASSSPIPLTVEDRVITLDTSGEGSLIQATVPSGEPSWTYQRDLAVCAISTAWGHVVATYKNHQEGCGDVVSVDGLSGTYGPTRSSKSPQSIVPIKSNDNVGTYDSSRLELWRSDLVRTVEYGEVYAPQEPDMQPRSGCTLTSALTRKSLLAVTETCDGSSYLRFQETVPEDSRKPEMLGDAAIPGNARLIAIGESAAAIYTGSEIVSYSQNGQEIARSVAAPSTLADNQKLFAAHTQDLKHYMSWFDGERLYLFNPEDLAVENVIEGVVGTGIEIADKLLVPTVEGIAVMNPGDSEPESLIPRPHPEPTSLAVAGPYIIEKSGGVVTALGG